MFDKSRVAEHCRSQPDSFSRRPDEELFIEIPDAHTVAIVASLACARDSPVRASLSDGIRRRHRPRRTPAARRRGPSTFAPYGGGGNRSARRNQPASARRRDPGETSSVNQRSVNQRSVDQCSVDQRVVTGHDAPVRERPEDFRGKNNRPLCRLFCGRSEPTSGNVTSGRIRTCTVAVAYLQGVELAARRPVHHARHLARDRQQGACWRGRCRWRRHPSETIRLNRLRPLLRVLLRSFHYPEQ